MGKDLTRGEVTVPIITANSQYCVPRWAPIWDGPAGRRVGGACLRGPPHPAVCPQAPSPLGAQDGNSTIRFYEPGTIPTIPALTLLPTRSGDKV